MRASVSFASLGQRGLDSVGVQPSVCPLPACCTPAPDAATEETAPCLMTSKYQAAL